MRKILATLIVAAVVATPAYAGDWRDHPASVQPGVFVGAKLRLSLGGKGDSRPTAALALAPTQSRISGEGMVKTNIGEGLALNFGAVRQPTLTLAGVRADRALGLTSGTTPPDETKLGMSDGAKIAVGVVAAVVAGAGVLYVVMSNRCTECDQ